MYEVVPAFLPGDPLLVRPAVLAALGWPWGALLALELALGFGFGASVGLAVPPMATTKCCGARWSARWL